MAFPWSVLPSLDPRERMRVMRDEFVLTLVIAAIQQLRDRVDGSPGGGLYVEADGSVSMVRAVTAAEYAELVDPDPAVLFVIV